MSLTPETVTIQKATTTGDGSGGKVTTWANVSGNWTATRNFYNKVSLSIKDEGTHAAQGPGVQQKKEQFFKFERPFPTIARDTYRIIGGDGVIYRVLHVRAYDMTMQVDVEAFS